MDHIKSEEKKRILANLFYSGFVAVIHSHQELFDSDDDKTLIAVTYLNGAHTYFVTAKVFYHDNLEILEHAEFDDTMSKFFAYHEEFERNIRINQRLQWSDIEFQRFVKSFKKSASLLELDISYWLDRIEN